MIARAVSMDFPDGQQRFNWCQCDGSPGSGLGNVMAPAPLFDFSFWSSQFSGGGQPIATPAPLAAPVALPPQLSNLFGGNGVLLLLVVGAVLFVSMRKR